uniref:Uncharacterized protein n=1 Tax=Timema monikensis TaxID=170555 RepID=A0A7R9EC39_9NEOP|nr:unnamed protein product [Timema monikensis]
MDDTEDNWGANVTFAPSRDSWFDGGTKLAPCLVAARQRATYIQFTVSPLSASDTTCQIPGMLRSLGQVTRDNRQQVGPVVQMNPSIIRQWLRGGDIDKLQQVVLEGQGHKLVGEYSPDPKARAFLKTVPAMMVSTTTARGLGVVWESAR